MGFWIAAAALAVFVVLLLVAEARESQQGKIVFKPLAATSFIVAALFMLDEPTPYAVGILVGLFFSWWGDVLLIPKDRPKVFQLGIFAFLLGHVAYAAAFLARGVDVATTLAVLVVLAAVAVAVLRWLRPHTPADLRGAVVAYIGVISAMLALAVGTWAAHGLPAIVVGAAMFYVSDLAVAMDRFVRPAFVNRLWGLPCYFGAQLVLAWTIAHAG